jgi:DNA-binding response OmpR family regulator
MATILVVEPSKNLRLLLEEALAERGYTVRAAATATEARACIAQDHPDLAIIEVALGGREGLQLLAHLLGASKDLPIIIHTATSELVHGLVASLADACVLKSSDLQPLLAAVARVLRRTELFSAPWRAADFPTEGAFLAPSLL